MAFRKGDLVELHSLQTSSQLNGKLGTLLRFDAAVGRWEVDLGAHGKSGAQRVVRVQPRNLRGDHILIQHQGAEHRVPRSAWSCPEDGCASAARLLVELVRPRDRSVAGGFNGEISIRRDGEPPEKYEPPAIMVLDDAGELWEEEALAAALRRPGRAVVQAVVAWGAPEARFRQSVARVVRAAHASTAVHLAVRTRANSARFGLLQALTEADGRTAAALLGHGCVVVDPTDAIAFQSDNMVKLPRSLSLAQAARKVEAVITGADCCPVCLEPAARAVFMPCQCSALIHAHCLQALLDNHHAACPLCRGPIGRVA